jgi:hypothetical protein
MEILSDWRNAVLILAVVTVLLVVALAVRRRRRGHAPMPVLDVAPATGDAAFLDSSHIISGPILDAVRKREAE